jgi:predicted NAD/FAD-dependent oxidoreductase
MSAFPRELAAGLEVRCGVEVRALERTGGAWTVQAAGGARARFERLVVTAPPAQAAELLGGASPLAERAARIELSPCWALLLGLAAPYEVPFDGAYCEGEPLDWIARDSSKPGRAASEAWVVHASPAWSAAHLDAPRELVRASLAAALERSAGAPLPRVLHADVHLWRFARPSCEPIGARCLHDPERGLALAGDAYSGGRIEGAWLSGCAAAERLLQDCA